MNLSRITNIDWNKIFRRQSQERTTVAPIPETPDVDPHQRRDNFFEAMAKAARRSGRALNHGLREDGDPVDSTRFDYSSRERIDSAGPDKKFAGTKLPFPEPAPEIMAQIDEARARFDAVSPASSPEDTLPPGRDGYDPAP